MIKKITGRSYDAVMYEFTIQCNAMFDRLRSARDIATCRTLR